MEEEATLDGQFIEFARFMDKHREGNTITLSRSDYWMRQARILDDRKLNMVDTGICFNKFCKSELSFSEWYEFLCDLCQTKNLDQEYVEFTLTNAGLPGSTGPVAPPDYKAYFATYKPKSKTLI